MDLFDLTLATPQENLALDEALLDEAEESDKPRESLRLWEAAAPLVVVGRNSQLAAEVRLDACDELGIPVLRRTSGGSTIIAGPGCLMYAVVLSYHTRPELRMLEAAHRHVLDTTIAALAPLVPGLARQGTSDLALGEQKVSGNSLRCRRRTFLYHGTLLYDFPLELVDRCLALPPRQPDYRHSRANDSFLVNLPAGVDALRQALVATWNAQPPKRDWPRRRVKDLVANRYGQSDWNRKR
jgi:lipoate---protein ligase